MVSCYALVCLCNCLLCNRVTTRYFWLVSSSVNTAYLAAWQLESVLKVSCLSGNGCLSAN